ncbi:GrBNV gp59-like protein-like protein [Mauternbach virus]|uniref:GrBNV gp59-like protein-like protein n=1 Tax=Mauternbach virus TaxID=2486603 RepID=A0A3G3E7L7_9VIRU|nr:GrBNV gp59-like protein-like protein [Mauternbach virus]AYP97980.1 GrBNV gp59-like protein-like protein [Mauternbach virus]
MAVASSPSILNDLTTFEENVSRDDRFKQILYEQFGELGIVSMVNQSLIFVIALVMIVSIMIGVIVTLAKTTTNNIIDLGPNAYTGTVLLL